MSNIGSSFKIRSENESNQYWTSDNNNHIALINKDENDPNQLWKLISTNTLDVYFIAKYAPGLGRKETCVTWVPSKKSFQLKPQDWADIKQHFRLEQKPNRNTTYIHSEHDKSVYVMHSNNLVGPGNGNTGWVFMAI
ncbi:18642_t:CDS:2 [Acaulospora morrowiae]|uniref:18642_t:CDS:1 n=1 Tax=Acaulospora morrowiae TaxID=94023 RepID=A0A9N9GMA4_9GLOM|nr:18642_t:CDS:2 [Acaulospora morrowiae]